MKIDGSKKGLAKCLKLAKIEKNGGKSFCERFILNEEVLLASLSVSSAH